MDYLITINNILDRLAEATKPLPRSLKLYQDILTAIKNSEIPKPEISSEQLENISERIAQRNSALSFNDLNIQWEKIQQLLLELLKLTEKQYTIDKDIVNKLRKTIQSGELIQKNARQWFENKLDLDEESHSILSSILHGALYPVIAGYRDKISGLVNQDVSYNKYCPVCGGKPDFSFLEKEKGARWLMCSRCDAIWVFQRLTCPFCGNEDHKKLGYLTSEKSPYRLYFCDDCHHYLKCIDLRQAKGEILLPLERVLTIDLDRQAQQQGYTNE